MRALPLQTESGLGTGLAATLALLKQRNQLQEAITCAPAAPQRLMRQYMGHLSGCALS